MKKTIFCGIVILFCLGFSGCSDDAPHTIISTRDIGFFVSAEPIPTSFNESIKSTIKTTKGTFTINGYVSGFENDPVVLKTKSNGRSYLFIGKGKERPVIGL